jgi:hypothetical protein
MSSEWTMALVERLEQLAELTEPRDARLLPLKPGGIAVRSAGVGTTKTRDGPICHACRPSRTFVPCPRRRDTCFAASFPWNATTAGAYSAIFSMKLSMS